VIVHVSENPELFSHLLTLQAIHESSFIDAIMHFMSLVYLPLPGRRYESVGQKISEYVEKAGIVIDADECLKIFNSYSEKYKKQFSINDQQDPELEETIHRQILADAGSNAQQNLYLKERFLIVMALLEFSKLNYGGDPVIYDEISRLAENLNLQKSDINDAFEFITDKFDHQNHNMLILQEDQHHEEELEGSWIEEYNRESDKLESRSIFQRIRGRLIFRYFSHFNLLVFTYDDTGMLFVNNKFVYPGYFYSSTIMIYYVSRIIPIHPEEILRYFKLSGSTPKIKLKAEDIAFFYTDSYNTVKPFSVTEESGKLIGIIGNNGVGKSTILKLIAGHLRPSSGNIYVNDTDLIKENFRIQSVIGFVSNDDMIFLSFLYTRIFYSRLVFVLETSLKPRFQGVLMMSFKNLECRN